MDIEVADTMPEGWQRWLDWQRAIAPNNLAEIRRWRQTAVATSATFV